MRAEKTTATPSRTACSSELHNSITQTKGQNMADIEFPYTRKHAEVALQKLHSFIGTIQLSLIGEMCNSEERRYVYSKLVELSNTVELMPTTYQTDGQGDQAVVHLHYFTAGADWYIVERDCESEQLQAFGKADLGMGYPELGYINIVELLECGAELDMHWIPRALSEI